MDEQPYDKWPRNDSEFEKWANLVEHIVADLNAQVILISHSNGFELPPNFKKIPGRDYPILKKLQELVIGRGNVKSEDVVCIEKAYEPAVVKAIIGQMDMMVAGRVHSSVAAVSQYIPTVFLPYTEEMNSTKMLGFASLSGMQDFVTINNEEDIKLKIEKCWMNREEIKGKLEANVPLVKQKAKNSFDFLRKLV